MYRKFGDIFYVWFLSGQTSKQTPCRRRRNNTLQLGGYAQRPRRICWCGVYWWIRDTNARLSKARATLGGAGHAYRGKFLKNSLK